MKQFIILYFFFLALLFILFYLPTSPFSIWLNEGQTQLTLFFLHYFLPPSQIKGIEIWINPNYKIIITQACNGMIPILFLFASILAYPSSFVYKIIWMAGGYVIFSLINVVRLLFVVHITQTGKGHADFYWSHDIVGNAVLMGTGLLLFILYIQNNRELRH